MRPILPLLVALLIPLTSVQTQTPKTVADYLQRAGEKMADGDFDGAIADYTKVIKLKSESKTTNRKAYIGSASEQLSNKDYTAAATDYTKDLEFSHEEEDGYYGRANALSQLKDFDAVII